MTSDLLERVIRALRSTSQSTLVELERAFERLERGKRGKRPLGTPRYMLRTAAWTLAATLLGVGVWANVTGCVSWFESLTPSAPSVSFDMRSIEPSPRRLPRCSEAFAPELEPLA